MHFDHGDVVGELVDEVGKVVGDDGELVDDFSRRRKVSNFDVVDDTTCSR